MKRAALLEMGLTKEQVDTIMDINGEDINEAKQAGARASGAEVEKLKAQLETTKAEYEKLKATPPAKWDVHKIFKSEDELKAFIEEQTGKVKAEIEEKYKGEYESKETEAKQRKAKEKALLEAGANPKFIEKMLNDGSINLEGIEFDGETVKEPQKLIEAYSKSTWGDLFGTTQTKGVEIKEPPANGGGRAFTIKEIEEMSAEEINKNWDSIQETLAAQKG